MTLLDQWTHTLERRKCLYPSCPEGRSWGICPEPAHWAVEEQRQDAAKDGGVSTTRIPQTTAHLASTISYNLAHAIRHTDMALDSKSPKDKQFNLEHVQHHLGEVREHTEKLLQHFRDHYPAEAKELDSLDDAIADTKCEGGPDGTQK